MTRRAIPNRKLSPPQARAWLCLVLSAAVLLPLAAAPVAAQGPEALPGTQLFAAADPAAGGKRFSLDFVATDLVDVIKALAAQSGANIAVSSTVSGTVTLRLSEVTVEEALTVISKINSLEFAKIDSTYVVGTPEEVKALVAEPPAPDQPLTEVVALQYVPAEDAMAIIGDVEPQVTCKASPTGGLILNGTPAALERAKALLAGVDVAPAMGIAERAIYTIKYADPREFQETLETVFPDLKVTPAPRSSTPTVQPAARGGALQGGMAALAAPQLSAQGQQPGGAGGVGGAGQTQELSHVSKLVLSGAPATLTRALKLCEELDVPPMQIKISATITEVRQDVEKRLGINWQDLAGKAGIIVGEASPSEFDSGLSAAEVAAHDLKLGSIMRSHLSIAGAINALVTEGNARIMANPTIMILDGRQATIHAGEKIYYPQIVGYTPLGGQIVQATEIDVGVTLMVNPRIGPDSEITLTLVPSISSITTSVFDGYPTITERSTVTTVRVKSGETLAIGGLIRDDETINVNKVPLLGDIPVIGDLLFKSTVRHPVRSEVVIIITPEIAESGAAS
ncbi:MAG: type II secretion system protein GspD [Armatimonadota bacterium]|nr:MAG: type II secretion system protein GspD [Armatimonadota bacterium]